jgi:hypothetical protein
LIKPFTGLLYNDHKERCGFMNAQEYYAAVIEQLRDCFRLSHYAVGTGNELIAEGFDPAFPAMTVPVHDLEDLTINRGLQVHIPLIGERSQSVLMPIDFEIFLAEENHTLYEDIESQKTYFKQIIPVAEFLEDIFRSRGIPYLLDYTPSGGHILFQNILAEGFMKELEEIGFLEDDVVKACTYIDPGDIRRWYGTSLEAARVFSTLGKIAEYIALLVMEAFRDNAAKGLFPVTISDSMDRCINIDNTWNEGSPFMRCIRSPFSMHKKNHERYCKYHNPPLVDIVGTYFDGKTVEEEKDMDQIIECMWDLNKAARHSSEFEGFIPYSNETLIVLLHEYKASDLYEFHRDFEQQAELPRGKAVEKALKEENIHEDSRDFLISPNPSALQPKRLIVFIRDFLLNANWEPRHIANILRDLYQNPSFNWRQDFFKYPSDEKANFWARTYSSVALRNEGILHV